jgi:hypothetical protein
VHAGGKGAACLPGDGWSPGKLVWIASRGLGQRLAVDLSTGWMPSPTQSIINLS